MLKTKISNSKPNPKPKTPSLDSYEKIDDKIFFKKMKYENVTDKMREEFQLFKKDGITIVIVDGKRHRPYLAPGQDPYEVRRKTIETLEVKHAKGATKKSSNVKVSKTISI